MSITGRCDKQVRERLNSSGARVLALVEFGGSFQFVVRQTFGGSAWKMDPTTNQYYYHYFYAEQPDLNWRNPAVEKAMLDTMRWWYKRGVSGFRLDAVDTLFEDPQLRDNPLLSGTNKQGDRNEDEIYDKKLPEVHDVLKKLRSVSDESNAVLIGETWTANIDEL